MPETSYTNGGVSTERPQSEIQDQELARATAEIENLKIALQSARTIGAAVGIVMALEKLTYDAAFAVIVNASQHQGRKLRELADEIVAYGAVLTAQDRAMPLAG